MKGFGIVGKLALYLYFTRSSGVLSNSVGVEFRSLKTPIFDLDAASCFSSGAVRGISKAVCCLLVIPPMCSQASPT